MLAAQAFAGTGATAGDDDGRGWARTPCTGCGEINTGHPGSRCPDPGAARREPTAAQVAYVEVLCERFRLPRPPLERWERLQVSRWITAHEGLAMRFSLEENPEAEAGASGSL